MSSPSSGRSGSHRRARRDLGERFFYAEDASAFLFTENDTNTEWLADTPTLSPDVKDGIGNIIVHGYIRITRQTLRLGEQ